MLKLSLCVIPPNMFPQMEQKHMEKEVFWGSRMHTAEGPGGIYKFLKQGNNNKYQGVKNFTLVARMQKIVALS